MNSKIFTLRSLVFLTLLLATPFIGCKKDTSESDSKQAKYISFKKSMLKGYESVSNAITETSFKHFEQSTGNVDKLQFEKDFRNNLAKYRTNTTNTNPSVIEALKGIRPWNRSKESLESYLEKQNATPNVAKYIVELNNKIEGTVRKLENTDIDNLAQMDQYLVDFSNDLKANAAKIEETAINDSNLSETEVLSIIASTAAVEGLTDGLVKSAKSCIKNFTDSFKDYKNNTLSTRGFWSWIKKAVSTVINIAAAVIVNAAVFAWNTFSFAITLTISSLTFDVDGVMQSIGDYFGAVVDYGYGYFAPYFGEYDCIIQCDLWRCGNNGC